MSPSHRAASPPEPHKPSQLRVIEGGTAAYTDLYNAERLAASNSDRFRYVHERKKWIHWRDGRWRDDATEEIRRAAKSDARRQLKGAINIEDADERKRALKWADKSHSAVSIRATLELARSEPEFAISQDQLDRHPFLLACANGTIDLRTGEPRPSDPADLITRGTNVRFDPDATCPRFDQFLAEVFPDDDDLVAWLQRFVGYCLTGDTREHVLAVFYGNGFNGKSTLLTVLRKLLGELSTTAAFDTFAPRGRGDHGPRNDLAGLHGARLVTASESGEGRKIDEATVKEITGGDTIACRFLYGEYFEYRPQFKIILSTNHLPTVKGTDKGIWRRIRLVPFNQDFEHRKDDTLDAKLDNELAGILAWAVRGCLAWQKDSLGNAKAVTKATEEYRKDEDVLGRFLRDRCVLGADYSVKIAHLRQEYENWCRHEGEEPGSAKALTTDLERRPDNIRSGQGAKGVRHYYGVRLAAHPTLEAVA